MDFANQHLDQPRFYGFCHRLVYYLLVANMKLGGDGDVEGGWYGNDTVWRMCLDLNRILLYADTNRHLSDCPKRKVLSIIDGLIAGQGDGPLKSDPRVMGVMIGAVNPAAADWISALLMGFQPEKLPIIANAFLLQEYPLVHFRPETVQCLVNGEKVPQADLLKYWSIRFIPPAGWIDQLRQ